MNAALGLLMAGLLLMLFGVVAQIVQRARFLSKASTNSGWSEWVRDHDLTWRYRNQWLRIDSGLILLGAIWASAGWWKLVFA